MRDVAALVLAGGRVEELSVLTQLRPKAAVPFGGQYRIIDFAISSLVRSGFQRIGVISFYRPSSLIDHLGVGEPWELTGRGQGIKLLPPYAAQEGYSLHRGTADAVFHNLAYVERQGTRDVLILSGDHIYGMDFRPLVEQHRRSGADLTMVVKRLDDPPASGWFGYASLDGAGRVRDYAEKPPRPLSDMVSLTIYLVRLEVLRARLRQNQRRGRTFQLAGEILPAMVAEDRVMAFRYDGYWNYSRTSTAYLQANQDLLPARPRIDLDAWCVRSRQQLLGLGDLPPARFAAGARCRRSVVAPGTCIAGRVTRSILFPGVHVEAGARVEDCVIMNDCHIGSEARLHRCILDKQVLVGRGARCGRADGAPTVIGKAARLAEGARVEAAMSISPGVGWPAAASDAGGQRAPAGEESP